jgi:hypothetical protein
VWLQLKPEFGGTAFGPLNTPEFRLGTADDNHVKLADGLGVEAHHVRLVRRSEAAWLLAPVERSATVWLWRSGARNAVQVQGPIVIVPGDAFSLVTAEGVCFQLVHRDAPRPTPGAARGPAPGGAMERAKQGMVMEVLRRARGAILTTWLGSMGQWAITFIRGRQFLSPVYIVGFLIMASGWMFGGYGCNAKRQLSGQLSGVQSALKDKESELADCRAGNEGVGRLDLLELTSRILRDNAWRDSLEWPELRAAMNEEIKATFARSEENRGLKLMEGWYIGKGNPYAGAAASLADAGMPPELASLLAWGAIDLSQSFEAQLDAMKRASERTEVPNDWWGALSSPNPEQRACQRGVFRLTYRQADALGLEVPPDALFSLQGAAAFTLGSVSSDNAVRVLEKLQGTVLSAGKAPLDVSQIQVTSETMSQVQLQDVTCVVLKDPKDERTARGTAARKLAGALGPEAARLPKKGEANWLSGRLAMLFAYDLQARRWDDLRVGATDLAAAFASVKEQDAEGYAMIARRAGQALGRAVAVPCVIVMTRAEGDVPEEMGGAPTFEDCALLKVKAEFNKL